MNVNISVFVNNKKILDQLVLSTQINKQANKISSATIKLLDGSTAKEDFKLSDDDDYSPGNPVSVKIGYGSNQSVVFSGSIVKQNLQVTENSGSMLILHCKDDSFKMAIGRKNATYENATDSDLIGQIISKYGLQKSVDSTSYTNKEIVQWYCSDWDFIVTRAEVNGMIVVTDQDKVTVQKPDTSKKAAVKLTYGVDIYDIDLTADAKSQYSKVQASSWDPKSQKLISANAKTPAVKLPGNFDPTKMASFADSDTFILQTTNTLEQDEIQNWADACLLKSRLSFITGNITFQGNGDAVPGGMLEIEGVGTRFKGNAFVWAVEHNIKSGTWLTEATLGADLNWYSEETENVEAPVAAGLLPGVNGVQNGVVKQIDSDPNNEFRVLVTIPLLSNKTVWARLANLYGTSAAGSYFYPEIGDEVILAFFNDDPRFPVILGSLYSSAKNPPYTPEAKNNTKAIVTKSKLKVIFDEEKKSITLITPQNNSVVLSDDNKSITLTDQNSNKIEMNSSGITIQSASKITIKAQKDITVQATNDIQVSATNELDLKGLNVNGTAEGQMVMKGNATSEFSASGQVTIKGTMVMIN
jgi:Rhs element Vgr protein